MSSQDPDELDDDGDGDRDQRIGSDEELDTPIAPSLDNDRILSLELVRATEAAAMAAARFLGRGDEDEVDGAAVDAIRPVLGTIPMRGVIVIGEGEKDDAPMLYAGEHVGSGVGPLVDIAIDPVDGAGLTAKSLPNAMSVIALADRGAMFDPGPCVYMDKIVVGPALVNVVDFFDAPSRSTLSTSSPAQRVSVVRRRHGGNSRSPTA